LVPGIIGDGGAIEFAAFAKTALQEKAMLAILADPANAALPTSLDEIYMMTSWLAYSAAKPGVLDAAGTLLSRIPPEFGVILVRDMLKADPAFARHAGYKAFIKEHERLIRR
jgi:hypothetical protein